MQWCWCTPCPWWDNHQSDQRSLQVESRDVVGEYSLLLTRPIRQTPRSTRGPPARSRQKKDKELAEACEETLPDHDGGTVCFGLLRQHVKGTMKAGGAGQKRAGAFHGQTDGGTRPFWRQTRGLEGPRGALNPEKIPWTVHFVCSDYSHFGDVLTP